MTETTCSICLEGISKNNNTGLDCGHSFHADCVNTWFSGHNTCPNCRSIALVNGESIGLQRAEQLLDDAAAALWQSMSHADRSAVRHVGTGFRFGMPMPTQTTFDFSVRRHTNFGFAPAPSAELAAQFESRRVEIQFTEASTSPPIDYFNWRAHTLGTGNQ